MSKPKRCWPSPTRTPDRSASSALIEALSQRLRQAIGAALWGDDPDAAAPPLLVERAAAPIAPERLAGAHPGGAAAQAQARGLYERCLGHYRSVVRAHESALAFDDVGAAAARFVAVNLRALRGIAASPVMLQRLENQLGHAMRRSASWSRAPLGERQACFEQFALLAVLVDESSRQAQEQGPAAIANLRRAARGYLQQLLGLDPDRLGLDAGGLSLRSADGA